MAGISEAVEFAIEESLKAKYDKMRTGLMRYCDIICREMVNNRLQNQNAHDFTGNFLNSMVAGLFERGTLIYAAFAFDKAGLKAPIQVKMTRRRTGKGGKRLGSYYFKVDYWGGESHYAPSVSTDQSYGQYDAYKFIHSYKPGRKSVFEIGVGYTTEYSNFIEFKHHSTGLIETYHFIADTALDIAESSIESASSLNG
jgi:hypothetical protein